MLHLGDITKISGRTALRVNVIIGGSPCQDLSVAGKRAGLKGKRSVLFLDQIRIIKEMREEDVRAGHTAESIRPRWMVWENVPGTFSAHGGEDFRCVLEETARVVEPDAVIPRPPKGKWANSGCIMGDGWSIAWRVLDAQFWGVPQRRRRIALVADFAGGCAPEILFERDGVSGNPAQSGETREETARDTRNGAVSADTECGGLHNQLAVYDLDARSVKISKVASSLQSAMSHTLNAGGVICIQGNCIDRADTAGCNGKGWTEDVSYTLNTVDRPAVAYVHDARGNGDGNLCPTLTGDHENRVTDYTALVAYTIGNGQADQTDIHEKAGALNCMHDQNAVMYPSAIAYSFDSLASNSMKSKNPYSGCREVDKAKTLDTTCPDPSKNQGGIAIVQHIIDWIVRRLTPLECERLQGYPDGWTDIGTPRWREIWLKKDRDGNILEQETVVVKYYTDSKDKKRKTSDSARYKALGNSIALPPWTWVLGRLSAFCGDDKTMASLFDGIGGFPLIWERLNGKGSCIWASEIDEFCIAVTKERFGDYAQYQTNTPKSGERVCKTVSPP